MEFFQKFDISDSDNESDQSYEELENLESRINPIWFEFTDEDEVDEDRKLFGKEKAVNDMQTIMDTYDYNIAEHTWAEAKGLLDDLMKRVKLHERKYAETPQTVREYIYHHPDISEELEGKTRHDFSNARDFAALKDLQVLVLKLKDDFKHQEDADAAEANAEEEIDGADESEEGFAQALIEEIHTRKNENKLLRRVKKCHKHGYTGLEITARGHHCLAVLKENMGLYVPEQKWQQAFSSAQICFELLLTHPEITLVDDVNRLTKPRNVAAIVGGLDGMVKHLQGSLLYATQSIKVHEKDYAWLPKAENELAQFADHVIGFYQARNRANRRPVVTCCEVLLTLVGYRTPEAHALLYVALNHSGPALTILSRSIMSTVKAIFSTVASAVGQRDAAVKMSAVCYIGYQMGLAGQFRQGRDLLLRSGVPDYLDSELVYPPGLSILYNRVIAVLGLAAFVAGEMEECYTLLGSLWEQYNPSVLIGQGVPPKLDAKTELRYRDQTVQHHYYIAFHHLELAAMLSALVIDTVNEAKKPYERSRVQRYFYRAINRRGQLIGPNPVFLQDQVAAAYRTLKAGDFTCAKDVVESMNAWRTLANGKEVLAKYLAHLKDAALRVFCFTNRSNFSTFSVPQLAVKYDMDEATVRDIVNDMISADDALIAYWDRDDIFLAVDRSNPTRLQHSVVGAADSVVDLAPYMERRSRVNEGRGRGGPGGRGGGRGGRGRGGRGGGRGY